MGNTFDFSTAIQSIQNAKKAFEMFASSLANSTLENFFKNLSHFTLSEEEYDRFLKKQRHRRAYYRMMERRKR